MKKYLPIFLASATVFTFFLLLFSSVHTSKAATATHVVISEVQIASEEDAQDEFIELYNPTDSIIDITGWRITKTNQAGTDEDNLVASLSGSIGPKSYILVAHPDYDGSALEDILYSAVSNSITDNNTVTLYSDAGITVVDQVGIGTATNVETAAAPLPDLGQSIERKAISSSTAESMSTGVDVDAGNAEDTDNNSNDFIVREISDPQNSNSPQEPVVTPTPTTEPTVTETPSPTEEPTPTVTEEVTPTTSPSITITETPSPSITPTPSTKPIITAPNIQIVCTDKIISFSIFGVKHDFTFPTCKLIRVN